MLYYQTKSIGIGLRSHTKRYQYVNVGFLSKKFRFANNMYCEKNVIFLGNDFAVNLIRAPQKVLRLLNH